MKDGKFETQAEIYQALLDGAKIRKDSFEKKAFIYLKDGIQFGQSGKATDWSFWRPQDWEFYQEPKQKIKIAAHMCADSCVYFCEEGSRVCQSRDGMDGYKRLSLSFDAEVIV